MTTSKVNDRIAKNSLHLFVGADGLNAVDNVLVIFQQLLQISSSYASLPMPWPVPRSFTPFKLLCIEDTVPEPIDNEPGRYQAGRQLLLSPS
jgi:hypothetical protein